MKNLILIIVLLTVVCCAAGYLLRAKKRGEHCVGCPYAKQCGGKACGTNKH